MYKISVMGVVIFLSACASRPPPPPPPQATSISISHIQRLNYEAARQTFRESLMRYLEDRSVWANPFLGDRQTLESWIAEYLRKSEFVGAQEPKDGQVLFLYKDKGSMLDSDTYGFVAIGADSGARAIANQFTDFEGKTWYNILVSNMNMCVAAELSKKPTVAGSFWSLKWDSSNKSSARVGCFNKKYPAIDLGNFMLDVRPRMPPEFANDAIFRFSSRGSMENFASVFFGAFPMIQYESNKHGISPQNSPSAVGNEFGTSR